MAEPAAPLATPEAPTAGSPAPVLEAPAATEPPKLETSTDPWANPDTAKAEIEKLRKENGAARTNAKAQAAEDARKEVTQSIAKALGLVEDDANDPAKLTASLTTSQAEAKQARVELAVFRNAISAGGDPAALLDSATFLKDIASIDANDATAVQAAIAAAVAANPRLGVAPDPQAPRIPAPNPAQGASGGPVTEGPQLTKQDVERLFADKKFAEIEKARTEGRLQTLLGG